MYRSYFCFSVAGYLVYAQYYNRLQTLVFSVVMSFCYWTTEDTENTEVKTQKPTFLMFSFSVCSVLSVVIPTKALWHDKFIVALKEVNFALQFITRVEPSLRLTEIHLGLILYLTPTLWDRYCLFLCRATFCLTLL